MGSQPLDRAWGRAGGDSSERTAGRVVRGPKPSGSLVAVAAFINDITHAIAIATALGHADDAAPANTCRTTREPLAANVSFVSV